MKLYLVTNKHLGLAIVMAASNTRAIRMHLQELRAHGKWGTTTDDYAISAASEVRLIGEANQRPPIRQGEVLIRAQEHLPAGDQASF